MAKIMGGTTATPMRVPDWEQTNPLRADYIKNKPNMADYATTEYVDNALANLPSGGVSFAFVTELPTTGETDTIYLLPANPQTESNLYDEYIFANGKWEKIGSASVEVNLDEYVKNTDYATGSKAGVVKSNKARCFLVDSNGIVSADTLRASEYNKTNTGAFLGIGTYENNKSRYVKEGITTNTIALTDEEKTTACNWLGACEQRLTNWRLIRDDTLTEASGVYKITTDSEGNAFALKKVMIEVYADTTEGVYPSSGTVLFELCQGNYDKLWAKTLYSTAPFPTTEGKSSFVRFDAEVIGTNAYTYVLAHKNVDGFAYNQLGNGAAVSRSQAFPLNRDNIGMLMLDYGGTGGMHVGTRIVVWGVDA